MLARRHSWLFYVRILLIESYKKASLKAKDHYYTTNEASSHRTTYFGDSTSLCCFTWKDVTPQDEDIAMSSKKVNLKGTGIGNSQMQERFVEWGLYSFSSLAGHDLCRTWETCVLWRGDEESTIMAFDSSCSPLVENTDKPTYYRGINHSPRGASE